MPPRASSPRRSAATTPATRALPPGRASRRRTHARASASSTAPTGRRSSRAHTRSGCVSPAWDGAPSSRQSRRPSRAARRTASSTPARACRSGTRTVPSGCSRASAWSGGRIARPPDRWHWSSSSRDRSRRGSTGRTWRSSHRTEGRPSSTAASRPPTIADGRCRRRWRSPARSCGSRWTTAVPSTRSWSTPPSRRRA